MFLYMRTRLTRPKLATPWPIQYEEPQLFALLDIGRRNERNVNQLGRKGAEILIRLTDMNGGIIPNLAQLRIQRLMTNRARKDARRK